MLIVHHKLLDSLERLQRPHSWIKDPGPPGEKEGENRTRSGEKRRNERTKSQCRKEDKKHRRGSKKTGQKRIKKRRQRKHEPDFDSRLGGDRSP